MKPPAYHIRAKVWLYSGKAAWHFITLPKKKSSDIKRKFGLMKRGWGSLPVVVTVGTTTWKTSIFPDSKRGAYLLPLKSEVRNKERLSANNMVSFIVEIRT